jgi:hypothetical protein
MRGSQSLVWRHRWEITRDERFRQSLLRYNREDCEALRLLVYRLDQIRQDAASDLTIEFATGPKRHATETGKVVHEQFERILGSAEEGSADRGMRVRRKDAGECEPRKRGARKGHQAYRRVIQSKVNRVVRVQHRRKCPKGHGGLVLDAEGLAQRTVTDLVFTRNGCRKTVTRYEGRTARCPTCGKAYEPPALCRLGNQEFGHAFQAWTVYQRVVLRLPYRIIAQVTEHVFGVGLSASSGVNFLRYLAGYYAPTEATKVFSSRGRAIDGTGGPKRRGKPAPP